MDGMKAKFPELRSDAALADEVRQRLKVRVEEWDKLTPSLDLVGNKPTTSRIDTEFDPDAQFTEGKGRVVGVKQERTILQRPIDSVDPVSGRQHHAWQIEMSNGRGHDFRVVTGDIDFLAILEPNGAILSEQRRLEVYWHLVNAVDMQHGESFSFSLKNTREEYLRCCTEGGEAMAVITPDLQGSGRGATAGFFIDNLSVMRGGPNSDKRKFTKSGKEFRADDWSTTIKTPHLVTTIIPHPSG